LALFPGAIPGRILLGTNPQGYLSFRQGCGLSTASLR